MYDELDAADQIGISMGRGAGCNSEAEVSGSLEIRLYDWKGDLKETRVAKNLVVNTGKTHIRLLMQSSDTAMNSMGVGTGSTAAAATDTALGSEITTGLSVRNGATKTTSGSFATKYSTTWAPGEATNSAITEAGIFNSTTFAAGTMLCRSVFTAIPKGASDTLTIEWTVTIS